MLVLVGLVLLSVDATNEEPGSGQRPLFVEHDGILGGCPRAVARSWRMTHSIIKEV